MPDPKEVLANMPDDMPAQQEQQTIQIDVNFMVGVLQEEVGRLTQELLIARAYIRQLESAQQK